jgi:hypothetical protein
MTIHLRRDLGARDTSAAAGVSQASKTHAKIRPPNAAGPSTPEPRGIRNLGYNVFSCSDAIC